jgi:hypothetical protein
LGTANVAFLFILGCFYLKKPFGKVKDESERVKRMKISTAN